ncbi:MAG: hypothetical protein HYZ37_13820 [Candidatus Solibacter usitatus]|nr:hypothetical protein [Candidatus Solibacter usitatus]
MSEAAASRPLRDLEIPRQVWRPGPTRPERILELSSTFLLLLLFGYYAWHALAPETQSDALHYHLALGAQAATTGGFPKPISFFTLIPQGTEALFAFAYAIGGESAAKLLHLVFLILTIPLFHRIAQQLNLAPWSTAAASLLYTASPVVAVSATCAYNDAALVLFTLAVFSLLLTNTTNYFAAGLCAGFCYAIKFTGGWVALLALLFTVIRRGTKPALQLAAGAAIVAGPWLLRNVLLTGNPFAPLMNSVFPNAYFHLSSENVLGNYLRTYDVRNLWSIPMELTTRGGVLQGLLGPVWLAAPLALLALRKREGRILLAAAALAAAPWYLNIGTRFLMPALPFLALAWMSTMPRVAAFALAFIHLAVSVPPALVLYVPQTAWVLPSTPRPVEECWDCKLVRLITDNTSPADRILDLAGLPAAAARREIVNYWQSATGERIVHDMQSAATERMMEWNAEFPPRELTAVRARFPATQSLQASLHEAAFRQDGGGMLSASVLWKIESWPNIWEAGLVLDRNLATTWRTWEPLREGMYWQASFERPYRISGARFVGGQSMSPAALQLWGYDGNTWHNLGVPPATRPMPQLNLISQAARMLRNEGFHFVAAQNGDDGMGRLGKRIANDPSDWGLAKVAAWQEITLYRVIGTR